jgi:hypothetical protein
MTTLGGLSHASQERAERCVCQGSSAFHVSMHHDGLGSPHGSKVAATALDIELSQQLFSTRG